MNPSMDRGADAIDSLDFDLASAKDALATGSYEERQRATLDLWRRRDLSRGLVQRASRDSDPEISGRARWVLNQWQRGILTDTPSHLAKKLQAMSPSQTIDTLMSAGRFRAVVVAFEESAGTSEWEERRDQIENLILTKYPVYVHAADGRDGLNDLVVLMGQVAKTRTMAISRVELMRTMGMPIPDDQLLPVASTNWTDADRLVGLVQVLVVLGRLDEAIDLLSSGETEMDISIYGIDVDSDDGDVRQRRQQLREVCFLMGRQWQRLCKELSAQKSPLPENTYDFVWFHTRLLIAADRCGDASARQRAISALEKAVKAMADPKTGDDNAVFERRLAWSTLAVHGEVEAAGRWLESTDPSQFASLAYAQSDPLLALERLGYPVENLEPRLAEIVENCARLHERTDENREATVSLTQLQSLYRYLFAAGRNDLAWQLCNEISRVPVRGDVGSDVTPREVLSFLLGNFGRSEWKQHFELYPGQDELTDRTAGLMVMSGSGVVDYSMWRELNKALEAVEPSSDLHRRAKWIRQLSRGDVPFRFRAKDLPGRLYQELTTKPSEGDADPFGQEKQERRGILPIGYAELFMRLGRTDLWLRCLQNLQASGDLNASLELADWVRRNGRTEDAASMYESLVEMIVGDEAVGRSVSVPDSVSLLLSLPIKQWSLAAAVQDSLSQQRSRRMIDLLACSPTPSHRRMLLQQLEDEGDEELVREIYQRLLAFMVMEQDDVTDFVEVAGEFATSIHEDQPDEATKWMELRLVAMVRHPDGYGPSTYIANSVICEGFRLEAAIAADDVGLVERTIARIEQLDPLEIDHLEGMLPSLTKAGHREIVVETLDRMIENGQRHFARGHRDAGNLNNLAWSLAVNDHRLDLAREWSLRSVAIEPETAIYRDTLAEILYRQGNADQALQIERACVLDDPGEHHLYKQIQRFEAQGK